MRDKGPYGLFVRICSLFHPTKTTTTDDDGDVDSDEIDERAHEGNSDDLQDGFVVAALCSSLPPHLVILPLWRSLVRLDGTAATALAAGDLEND